MSDPLDFLDNTPLIEPQYKPTQYTDAQWNNDPIFNPDADNTVTGQQKSVAELHQFVLTNSTDNSDSDCDFSTYSTTQRSESTDSTTPFSISSLDDQLNALSPINQYNTLQETHNDRFQSYLQEQSQQFNTHKEPLVVHLPLPALPVNNAQQYGTNTQYSAIQQPTVIATQKPGSRRRRYITVNNNTDNTQNIGNLNEYNDIKYEQYDENEDTNENGTPLTATDKKERNKASASAYRKRRKQYLDTLESTVEGLHNTIHTQSTRIQQLERKNVILTEQIDFMKRLCSLHNIQIIEPDYTDYNNTVYNATAIDADTIHQPKRHKSSNFVGAGYNALSNILPANLARHSTMLMFVCLSAVLLFSPLFVENMNDLSSNLQSTYIPAGRKLFSVANDMYTTAQSSVYSYIPDISSYITGSGQQTVYSTDTNIFNTTYTTIQ